ncbi:MAG: hypothetical protein NC217_07760 [Muribaculaceae bacterium]|nr:hypothetical protein [Muribaculaceae bacterium]
MPDYLAQWLIHERGGELPVRLARGSVESKFLELFLKPHPEDVTPQMATPDMVPVVIPEFKKRDPMTYNYLPPRAVISLVNLIRDRFDLELWQDLHHFGHIGEDKKELIESWLEKNGMEQTGSNWDAVSKRYQRERERYEKRRRASEVYLARKKKCPN